MNFFTNSTRDFIYVYVVADEDARSETLFCPGNMKDAWGSY